MKVENIVSEEGLVGLGSVRGGLQRAHGLLGGAGDGQRAILAS